MRNPSDIVDAVVEALQSIPDLVTAMGGADNIKAHHFLAGSASSLQEAIYSMTGPSTLVVWSGSLGGNYNAATLFKDKVDIYVRMANAAVPVLDDNGDPITPVGYEDLWKLIIDSPLNGTDP